MGDPPKRRASYEDVLRAPSNRIAEVIDGELHLHPRPGKPHAAAATALSEELGPPFKRGRGGPGGDPALRAGTPLGKRYCRSRPRRVASRTAARAHERGALVHAGAGLGMRGAIAIDRKGRSGAQAPDLRSRRHFACVVGGPPASHARGAPIERGHVEYCGHARGRRQGASGALRFLRAGSCHSLGGRTAGVRGEAHAKYKAVCHSASHGLRRWTRHVGAVYPRSTLGGSVASFHSLFRDHRDRPQRRWLLFTAVCDTRVGRTGRWGIARDGGRQQGCWPASNVRAREHEVDGRAARSCCHAPRCRRGHAR